VHQRPNARAGGRILVDTLVAQGVEHVFCVPGESYLAVLDALRDAPIRVTVCRQEGGAAMMADASARLTGRPGVCFVTRGPGATNASAGVHIAQHDSIPLILFIGQIGRDMKGRGAFQEVDYSAFYGSVAKAVMEIDNPARIPEIVSRAFHLALQGRQGPVVIALPEDMLRETAQAVDATRVEPAEAHPGPRQMSELGRLLAAARKPIAVLGGSGWTPTACGALRRFAERFDLPVASSFRRQGLLSADHPNYVGEMGIGPNPKLKARIAAADLVLLVGARMSEMPSQSYSLFEIPEPRQTIVHVLPDPAEIGRVYHPALAILAAPEAFCAALDNLDAPRSAARAAALAAARADYVAWSETPPPAPGEFDYGAAVVWLRQRLPEDAIIAIGAGNFTIWPLRFLRWRLPATQLSPASGSMGYGLPAAVGAKRVHPDRMVVCFAGDGDFLMHGQEFATAVQYGLPIVVILVDNGMYGTIRMHQERKYPGRVSATELRNPDFAAYARAFGGHGETVTKTQEFAPAFERALASGLPSILHVRVDPDAITPVATLSGIRAAALAVGGG
jgi:acetolactate synthase-1/2/3 large subunit